MSKFIQENYDLGYSLSLDLIDELGFKTKDNPSVEHFAGMFTCLFNMLYVMQDKNEVDKVVSLAQEFAYKDAMKELNKR